MNWLWGLLRAWVEAGAAKAVLKLEDPVPLRRLVHSFHFTPR